MEATSLRVEKRGRWCARMESGPPSFLDAQVRLTVSTVRRTFTNANNTKMREKNSDFRVILIFIYFIYLFIYQ